MIEVQDLRVDYDQVCAVRDLTLSIPSGEIFGLIGPNGAGKTTTLRTLTGLIEPTYGEIVMDGVDMRENREQADMLIGFMPDSAPLYDDITVWEYLDMFAASYMAPPERRPVLIQHYLGLVDLSEKSSAMTGELSRGMKQRLMLAKTLIGEPRILLLDEPASGMDPHGRALLKEVMKKLRSEGKTVIISSHILAELSDFCTSVGIMERGQMVLSGPVEEVTARVLGQGRMAVEILSGAEELKRVVLAYPGAGSVQQEGNLFEFPFEGSPEAASALLTALVNSGVQITSFVRKQADLEEVFLKVGAKEVS